MKITSMAAFALVLAAALVSPASAQVPVTYTYTYNGPALFIYHDSANIISIANVFVPRAIRITKVTANVQIDYPRPGDLNIFMYSPILTRARLLERNCGSQGTVADITFDDAAPNRYNEVCPATPGTYRGNEPLSNFNNQIAFGTWSLAAENNGSDDFVGYLRGFTLTLTGIAVTDKPITSANAVVNDAGLTSGPVAPGELIDILGFNLGPFPAVSAPAGDLPTSLGGVQVTFSGTPAAISYVSSSVLKVQVPVSADQGTKTDMRVEYRNISDSITLDVLHAAPGVYTQSASGNGPLKVVNPDGTVNSQTNPAPKGQVVAFYAAGLGTVTPVLATGQTPPNALVSHTDWPVTAVLDGLTAEIIYAGSAPGQPGVYQVNLRIPAGAGSGARPFTLFGSGAPSQSGVTIFVQ